MPAELAALVSAVQGAVKDRRKRGGLPLSFMRYIRYRLDDFYYGDTGAVAHGLRMEPFTRPDWNYAGWQVAGDIHNTPEFSAAATALARLAREASQIDTHLSNFVMRVAAALAGTPVGEEELAAESRRLLALVSVGPEAQAAKVDLVGLVLLTPRIDLPGIVIRQPRREDFEREVPDLPYRREQVKLPLPSAIAELNVEQIRNWAVAKLLTMLRLFVVAGVKHRGCLIDWGPSICSDGSSWIPGDDGVPTLEARIEPGDVDRLRRFWLEVAPVLPPELHQTAPQTVNHVFVAYERYCAALLSGSVFEERVANAVMGLEALFLGEQQGGAYRCRLRTARAMAFLGETPRRVFDLLGHAYKARNCFVHGERLPSDAVAKMTSTYGDRERIYRDTLQFLRKGLVSTILAPMQKKDLIKAIDESLVDRACAEPLEAAFKRASAVV